VGKCAKEEPPVSTRWGENGGERRAFGSALDPTDGPDRRVSYFPKYISRFYREREALIGAG